MAASWRRSSVVAARKSAALGAQMSQWPQGRVPSAVSPKWRMRLVMRQDCASAKAAMRSIWERRKATWLS